MIDIANAEKDALVEISNVGMSKAARQLSMLLDSSIEISIPQLKLYDKSLLTEERSFFNLNELAYVYQRLSGAVDGCASLVFEKEHGKLLTRPVIGELPEGLSSEESKAMEQEAILEIGNIIISSCVSAMVDMLSISVSVTVPDYSEQPLLAFINDFSEKNKYELTDILLISARFQTERQEVSGSFMMVLTHRSIESLLEGINQLLGEL